MSSILKNDAPKPMKKKNGLLFYVIMIVGFVAIMYAILARGKSLETARRQVNSAQTVSVQGNMEHFLGSFHQNIRLPLPVILLQVVVIILVARLLGVMFKKMGQPAVIGEIVAGVMLGPSLLGMVSPAISGFLFPIQSMGNLQFLSQLGLILFMFVIGMELDIHVIRRQAADAVIISHASIIIPYLLGMGLSYFLYDQFAPASVPFLHFSLFMGIAMSITAFPVLARILQERGMTSSRLGVLAITCAAADDVTAWCILAALIAIIKAGSSMNAVFTIALVIFYCLLMIFPIRMLLQKIQRSRRLADRTMMALVFVVLLLSAFTTETIGIHALFGAFIAGLIMPQDMGFRKMLINKIEDVSIVLLLPIFFVMTGLRTQIGLISEPGLWISFGWILLVAMLGKFGGSTLAAKIVGQTWKDSLSIGALMNTRGLMELIVLNIGYDLGILSPQIFSMLVLMALVTTFMTNPALNWIERRR
jgi:Kef-type K+ transport system membrane component KefB